MLETGKTRRKKAMIASFAKVRVKGIHSTSIETTHCLVAIRCPARSKEKYSDRKGTGGTFSKIKRFPGLWTFTQLLYLPAWPIVGPMNESLDI